MNKKQKKTLIRIIISLILVIASAITFRLIDFSGNTGWILKLTAYLIPYFVIGYDILKKAWKGILNRQVMDENFLMSVATIGAFALGEFEEATAVMLFYQIGELFQSYAVGKSRRNISDLMDIRPDYANIEIDGKLTQTDPDEVTVGSIIVVQPGEKIPIDGIVSEGNATLNTSALTGESVPREVQTGDEVISGSVNINGVLKIQTTKEFGESTVSKILNLVENASSKKSRSENFITKFARYYTPAVCFGALALALLPPVIRLAVGMDALWGQWIYRALTFLVISCPCALVISIPLSFFAGIGCASHEGILVKGSNYMETLARTKYVVFDKTGTMTEGVFKVTDIESRGIAKEQLLGCVAYAESFSNHPISRSIKEAYENKIDQSRITDVRVIAQNEEPVVREIDQSRVTDVREIPGHGVVANVGGVTVLAGNEKLMKQQGIDYEKCDKTGTIIYAAIDGIYAGYIVISDEIKPEAKEAVETLKNSGVKKNVMLTGDHKAVADDVANRLGIDEVHSELLPADKVQIVEKLLEQKSEKETLAFVGDGINDAPVLSRADLGIAMGAMGSDAAIEAADVVLMDDNPVKISLAIRIAKKCIRIVYENIYFAIGVKALCLVLGAVGIANMWLAIFADVGVMVLAVVNAIRALIIRK